MPLILILINIAAHSLSKLRFEGCKTLDIREFEVGVQP